MPLELAECAVCRKAFVRDERGGEVCPSCRAEAETLYEVIRTLLRDHPDLRLTLQDVAELLGVEDRVLQVLVSTGHLELRSGPRKKGSGGKCLACGAPLGTGSLCSRCLAILKKQLGTGYGSP